jgi:hypothetical protein
MISPSLNINLPSSTASSSAAKAATPPAPTAAAAPAPAPAASALPAPSTTVTLSPQALAASHASPPSNAATGAPTPPPAPVQHDSSVYDSLKNGISTAVTDVGDVIAEGAHAVVDGVETAVSTVHNVAKGIVELPFAAVAKACDAAGALIDEL